MCDRVDSNGAFQFHQLSLFSQTGFQSSSSQFQTNIEMQTAHIESSYNAQLTQRETQAQSTHDNFQNYVMCAAILSKFSVYSTVVL